MSSEEFNKLKEFGFPYYKDKLGEMVEFFVSHFHFNFTTFGNYHVFVDNNPEHITPKEFETLEKCGVFDKGAKFYDLNK